MDWTCAYTLGRSVLNVCAWTLMKNASRKIPSRCSGASGVVSKGRWLTFTTHTVISQRYLRLMRLWIARLCWRKEWMLAAPCAPMSRVGFHVPEPSEASDPPITVAAELLPKHSYCCGCKCWRMAFPVLLGGRFGETRNRLQLKLERWEISHS